jgi:hypothetical protein
LSQHGLSLPAGGGTTVSPRSLAQGRQSTYSSLSYTGLSTLPTGSLTNLPPSHAADGAVCSHFHLWLVLVRPIAQLRRYSAQIAWLWSLTASLYHHRKHLHTRKVPLTRICSPRDKGHACGGLGCLFPKHLQALAGDVTRAHLSSVTHRVLCMCQATCHKDLFTTPKLGMTYFTSTLSSSES